MKAKQATTFKAKSRYIKAIIAGAEVGVLPHLWVPDLFPIESSHRWPDPGEMLIETPVPPTPLSLQSSESLPDSDPDPTSPNTDLVSPGRDLASF